MSSSQKLNTQHQTLPLEFSPSRKQPPSYNPPPPFSPLKSIENSLVQKEQSKTNVGSNLTHFMPIQPDQQVHANSPTNTARSLLPQMNESQQKKLIPGPSGFPGGASPPLVGASQQLVMSLNDEFRASKVMKVQQEAQDASQQEALAALQATGWDASQAAKQIIKDRIVKVESLFR